MSPMRHINDHRSYLTETVYDAQREEFIEKPLPHPFAASVPEPPMPAAAPSPMSADDGLPDFAAPMQKILHETQARLRAAHGTHLGYPYNLAGGSSPFRLASATI